MAPSGHGRGQGGREEPGEREEPGGAAAPALPRPPPQPVTCGGRAEPRCRPAPRSRPVLPHRSPVAAAARSVGRWRPALRRSRCCPRGAGGRAGGCGGSAAVPARPPRTVSARGGRCPRRRSGRSCRFSSRAGALPGAGGAGSPPWSWVGSAALPGLLPAGTALRAGATGAGLRCEPRAAAAAAPASLVLCNFRVFL